MPAEFGARRCSMLGLARILMPARFGGYDLDFDTWNDAVLEISHADASHGWCASLIVHHAHLVAQFPEECQQAVWADGPDVAIAASFAPRAQGRARSRRLSRLAATTRRSPAASITAPG